MLCLSSMAVFISDDLCWVRSVMVYPFRGCSNVHVSGLLSFNNYLEILRLLGIANR